MTKCASANLRSVSGAVLASKESVLQHAVLCSGWLLCPGIYTHGQAACHCRCDRPTEAARPALLGSSLKAAFGRMPDSRPPRTARMPLTYSAHVCRTSAAQYTWKRQASQHKLLPCRPLEEIYADFEEQPVASGSIAQIHKAKLTVAGAAGGAFEPGKVVAVKVGHCVDSMPADPAAPA